jgi:hypothetical protein
LEREREREREEIATEHAEHTEFDDVTDPWRSE